jgi:hypothetical protein
MDHETLRKKAWRQSPRRRNCGTKGEEWDRFL